jgi:DNA-directed RNA polymerase specialized sigma24 family protein
MSTHQDLSALLQQGTREYAKLYERHAYRVYNLALRTACSREGAIKAAEEAFLTQVARTGAEGDLLRAAAKFAIRESDGDGAVAGAGGAEAEALLRATSRLPAPERAALALANLTGAATQEIGAVLELTDDAAGGVLTRAYEGLAAAMSVSPETAQTAYEAWLLAEPPAELWERIYPRFYTQLEKEARGQTGTRLGPTAGARRVAGGAVAKASARRERRRARRAERESGRRLLRPRTLLVIALLGTAAYGVLQYTGSRNDGAEFAALADGEIPGVDAANAEDVARSDGDPYDPLTPKELDKLRMQELKDLRAQGEEEQAKQLEQRRKQAHREQALARRERARERKRAILERKRAVRERRLAEKQHRAATRRDQQAAAHPGGGGDPSGNGELGVTIEEYRSQSDPGNGGSGNNGSGSGGTGGRSEEELKDECLWDESSGSYRCPD